MAKLKILKTGETNIESTDIWRFCYHSDYSTFKIYAQGTFNMTLTPIGDGSYNEVTNTLNHNLGYRPICFFHAVIGSQSIPFHGQTIFTNSGALDYYGDPADPLLGSTINTNDIDFRFIAPFDVQSSVTATINYIIMLDEF